MRDLVILHLSDLHIDDKGCSYSKLLKALLNDIAKQIESVQDKGLVIIVTGDIIDHGNKNAIENAKKFFKKLKEITAEKFNSIYIVPGNHDKKRTEINSYLVSAYRSVHNDEYDEYFKDCKQTIWPIHKDTYNKSGYSELSNYIYNELFKMAEMNDIIDNTYGVKVDIVNGRRICFVLLNTAWSSFDERDIRRLILGRFQIDEIMEKFHKLTDEVEIDLTVVIGHHPIECLCGTEQDKLFSYLISYNELSANVYLCGHTHDRTVINWSNNRHAINTLMTGFGWPEHPDVRVHDHYYSIYEFNFDLNALDIYVRKTNDGSGFIPDLSIYTGEGQSSIDKLVRPIRFQEAQGTVELSSADEKSYRITYASSDFLQYSKFFFDKIQELLIDAKYTTEVYKKEFLSTLKLPRALFDEGKYLVELLNNNNLSEVVEELSVEQKNQICNVLKYNSDAIYNKFQSFIQRLCQRMHEELVVEKSKNKTVRFHFRYLADKSLNIYTTLCASFYSFKGSDDDDKPSDIKYGDLLESTFNNKKSGCLIYSLNKEACDNKLKSKWKNFITVVPKFERNTYTKKFGRKSEKNYPLITFGVTTNNSEDEIMLQCMDFFAFDKVLSRIIEGYLDAFLIDLDGFINWVKLDDRKER